MPVRSGQDNTDRQTVALGEHGPLLPGLAAIGRIGPGIVATAGCFDTTSIDAEVFEIEADHVVESLEHNLLETGEDTVRGPLIAAGPQCRC